MKLNTPYKTVLFYGHVLRVEKDKSRSPRGSAN